MQKYNVKNLLVGKSKVKNLLHVQEVFYMCKKCYYLNLNPTVKDALLKLFAKVARGTGNEPSVGYGCSIPL